MNLLNWFGLNVLPGLYTNDISTGFSNAIKDIRSSAGTIFLAFAALIIVIGGYYYSGSEDSKRKGKDAWLRAGIGTLVVLAAVAFITWLQDIGKSSGF